jgi:hypothetical protein
MKKSNSPTWLTPGMVKVLLICGAVVLILVTLGKTLNEGVRKIFEMLNLADTPEEKAIKKADAGNSAPSSPWSPERWKNMGKLSLTVDGANALAKRISWAISPYRFWGDDEAEVFACFKTCTTQSDVSFLVWRFKEVYNKDLYYELHPDEWWNSYGLNDEEFNKVLQIVSALPAV